MRRSASEPLLVAIDVDALELFRGLREVGDAVDDADDPHHRGTNAADEQLDQQHDHSGIGVAQQKLVDSQ